MVAVTGSEPLMTEPLLLGQFIPQYDHAIVYSQVFRAPPQDCFEALVSMDILQIPVIRLLIRARGLPQRVADAVRGRGAGAREVSWPATFRVRDLGALGWIKLGERPGAELVFGVVGKPWQPVASGSGEPVAAGQFAGFDEPGFAKIAESTRVDRYGDRSSIVIVESRVALTDEDSRRRFRRYWLMLGPFMKLMRPVIMRALERQLQQPSRRNG
jgi:hypothetical protein